VIIDTPTARNSAGSVGSKTGRRARSSWTSSPAWSRRPCRLYEHRKHDGGLPLVGVNTFTDPGAGRAAPAKVELARATEAGKQSQLDRLAGFRARHAETAPAALRRLKEAAAGEQNVFAAPMEAVRCCSPGQISEAFFEVGGQYRRNV
jgi:isobutyryl-CoA mutase